MIKHLLLAATAITFGILAMPACAQESSSQAVPGEFGYSSDSTNNFRRTDSFRTNNQRLPNLQPTETAILSPISGPTGRNGLPMTSLDSFVLNSAGEGELIFGNEGANGPPPFSEFTPEHRIERGIQGVRAEGLTTFHGTLLPAAWGGDEFVKGTEWLQAGRSHGGAYGGIAPQLTSSRRFASSPEAAQPGDSLEPSTSNTRPTQQNVSPESGF